MSEDNIGLRRQIFLLFNDYHLPCFVAAALSHAIFSIREKYELFDVISAEAFASILAEHHTPNTIIETVMCRVVLMMACVKLN